MVAYELRYTFAARYKDKIQKLMRIVFDFLRFFSQLLNMPICVYL